MEIIYTLWKFVVLSGNFIALSWKIKIGAQTFRGAMCASCYLFHIPKIRFHGFNTKVSVYTDISRWYGFQMLHQVCSLMYSS
jgi:hypothetical protein